MTTPQPSIRPTKPLTLVAVFVAIALVSWAVVSNWYGAIPPLRWYMPVGLGLAAAAEALAARVLKRRITKVDGTLPPNPLVAARAVVLGKATAYLGAGFAGLWTGTALYTASEWGYLLTAKTDTVVALAGIVLSGALVWSGLWLENICRIRGNDDPDDER